MTKKYKPITINKENSIWEMVIGLEVHAQIKTNLKLFSNGATEFGTVANHNLDLLFILALIASPVLIAWSTA